MGWAIFGRDLQMSTHQPAGAAGLRPSDRVAAATAADECEVAAQPELTTAYTGRKLQAWEILDRGNRTRGPTKSRIKARPSTVTTATQQPATVSVA